MTTREQDAREAIARLKGEHLAVTGQIERLRRQTHQAFDRLRAVERDIRAWARHIPPTAEELSHCHAGRDGACGWVHCPQIRDGEPKRSGRHCPLDRGEFEG